MPKLFCLNIERSTHLDRFIPHLVAARPDVACLQEVMAGDLDRIRRDTGLNYCHYANMAIHPIGHASFGVAILSRTPLEAATTLVYAGDGTGQQLFDRTTEESKVATCRYVLAKARVKLADQIFTLATTHFPWTPDGEPRPFQTAAADKLIAAIGTEPIILTGDFNAPRGGPIFAAFAAKWRDNIPPSATTSLDPELHRAGPLDLMVDGLFTSPEYTASDVRLVTGLSDHQGIAATIRRIQAT